MKILFGQGGLGRANESQCWFCSVNVDWHRVDIWKNFISLILILILHIFTISLISYPNPHPLTPLPHISLILLSTLLLLSYTLLHSIISCKEDIVRLLRVRDRVKDWGLRDWLLFEFRLEGYGRSPPIPNLSMIPNPPHILSSYLIHSLTLTHTLTITT